MPTVFIGCLWERVGKCLAVQLVATQLLAPTNFATIVAVSNDHAVFVEGAIDPSPEGVDALVSSLAHQYGMSPNDLKGRFARGRFCVKTQVSRTQAEALAKELAHLGARVSIGAAATATAAARPSSRALDGAQGAAMPYQSGLAAAFSAQPQAAEQLQSFDALANLSGRDEQLGAVSLASLDGQDVAKPPPRAATSPAVQFAPSAKANDAEALSLAADAFGPPVDLFAPPDERRAQKMELAEDLAPRMPRPVRKQVPVEAPPVVVEKKPNPVQTFIASWRARFAAGVMLAVLLGFIPASLWASGSLRRDWAEVDHKVMKLHAEADTYETWETLDRMRAVALDRKRSAQRHVASIAMVIWGLVGGAVAAGWFRGVPWAALQAKLGPSVAPPNLGASATPPAA